MTDLDGMLKVLPPVCEYPGKNTRVILSQCSVLSLLASVSLLGLDAKLHLFLREKRNLFCPS